MKDPQLEYQRQAIKNASPTELVTKLYDFAILACYKKDEEKLSRVLKTLMQSLNFDFEISESLYGLYEYCHRQAKNEAFDEIRELLEPVREAWVEGVVKAKERPTTSTGNGFVV